MRFRHYPQAVLLIVLLLTMTSACVVAPTTVYPPAATYYYVSPTTTYLRECPSYECTITAMVFSGDRVQFLDSNDYGWSRVTLLRSGAVGWIPTDLLSSTPISLGRMVSSCRSKSTPALQSR